MGKFTNLNRIKKQAELIETLADRVNGDIGKHCEALKTHCYYSLPPEGWTESPEPVLYMMKNTKTIYAGYYGEGGVWKDKYFRQYADSRNGVDADDVTCWMYQCDLPQPTKGE